MAKDYYNTLGVAKSASADEVKRAFRKLAQQHHPDKGGDPEKFKEISEAYQILSNVEKRQQYDQYGHTFEQARAQGGFRGFEGFGDFSNWAEATGVNFEDLFSGAFSGGLGDIFGMGQRGGARQRRGRDLEVAMEIHFAEAIFGVRKTLTLERRVECRECHGTGAEKGTDVQSCSQCGGAGRVRQVQQTIFGAFQQVRACPACEGAGKVPKTKCATCRGSGTQVRSDDLAIEVPPGVDDGTVLEMRGGGEAAGRGGAAGSLYVRLRVRPDARFTRDGETIRSQVAVSAPQAALGDTVDVPTVDGDVALKIPTGTQPGDQLRLKHKGVPRRSGSRGDHIVTVDVKIPEKLSRKAKQLWEDLRSAE
ncbi:MAG: molecular chaperone DnaJ [bacterium]|nr:molecular chaperone DnaJ [bacterium]